MRVEDRRGRRATSAGRCATSPTSSSPRSTRRRRRRHHQQRRAGVVRAVARERAADQRDGREERARSSRASSARGWSTCRRATSRASAKATSGRTSRSSATSRAARAIARDWGGDDDLLDRDFDPAAEIADCQKMIDQARERSNDRQHISEFREKGAETLRAQRRDPDDENDLKIAVARERKIWMNDVLTKLGMERAAPLGLDQHVHVHQVARRADHPVAIARCASTIVRPAIVESAVRYPFPGWNEGFNTTAPLMYLMLKGHRNVPMGDGHRARRHPGRLHRRRHAARDRGGARRRARADLPARRERRRTGSRASG